jgi:hypothetical protein
MRVNPRSRSRKPAGPGEVEGGRYGQQLAQEYAQLEAGQVSADAGVRAVAERQVPVRPAVDDAPVRVLEGGRIVVGEGESERHQRVPRDRTASDGRVGPGPPPDVGQRRQMAQELLHGNGQQLGLPGQPGPLVRVAGQVPDRSGDGIDERAAPGCEHEVPEPHQLVPGQGAAVHLGPGEPAEQVVARASVRRVDDIGQIPLQARIRAEAPVPLGIDVVGTP